METFQIYKNLAWLNDLPQSEAESVLFDCCRSTIWACRMADARPFSVLDDLFDAAERVWFSLSPTDLLEVFAANGAERAEDIVDARLVEANRLYENKFGFIFILCTSGKTVDDVLAICRARIGNSADTELKIAADEQRKITEIKLSKLLER